MEAQVDFRALAAKAIGKHLVAFRLKADNSRTNSLKLTLSNAWTTALARGLTLSSGMLRSSSDDRKP